MTEAIGRALSVLPLSSMYDCWEPAHDDAIASLEHQMGAAIPDDYRAFLRLRNGGAIDVPASVPSLQSWGGANRIDAPRQLYSVGAADALPWRDVSSMTDANGDYMPESSVAIGTTGENVYCIDLLSGRVGYIDRDSDLGTPPTRVANSFGDFIRSLEIDWEDLRADAAHSCARDTPEYFIKCHDTASLRQWAAASRPSDLGAALSRLYEAACEQRNREAALVLVQHASESKAERLLEIAEHWDFADGYLMVSTRFSGLAKRRPLRSAYVREFFDRFGGGSIDRRYPPLG